MDVNQVELGRWYELVTDRDEILVGQVQGYRVQPHGAVFARTLFLSGVSESGCLAVDVNRVRRLRPVVSVPVDLSQPEA